MFNHNSTGNRSKPVLYAGKIYKSGEALRRSLSLTNSGLVSQAIKNGHKLKGYFVKFKLK